MSSEGNIARNTLDLLIPDADTTRIIFRKFNGSALAEVASGKGELKESDVISINLKVNPQEISYSIPKITQKVQTSLPGRFTVFDWGTDLETLVLQGNTGNMLPGIIQSGFDPLDGTIVENVAQHIDPSRFATGLLPNAGGLTNIGQNLMMGTMSYFELLDLSPKYRVFKNLKELYETFDADMDVLTLEVGDNIYRGFFNDFSFTQTAESPWNWKYSITFVSINNLASKIRRGDPKFNKSDLIVTETEVRSDALEEHPIAEDIGIG